MNSFGYGNFEVIGSGGGGGGGMTPQEVKTLINKNNDEVIVPAINAAVSSSAKDYDDTKVYSTYNEMVSASDGRVDVLYIVLNPDASHPGTRYVWSANDGFSSIESRIDDDSIASIFN